MIRGRVERNRQGGLEAWITLPVMDANGEYRERDVILDTGFTGWLVLPATDIGNLGLVNEGQYQAILASGNAENFEYYETSVLWHGRTLPVQVFQSTDQPLLGMELLQDSRVTVDAWEGGDVIIEEARSEPSA